MTPLTSIHTVGAGGYSSEQWRKTGINNVRCVTSAYREANIKAASWCPHSMNDNCVATLAFWSILAGCIAVPVFGRVCVPVNVAHAEVMIDELC